MPERFKIDTLNTSYVNLAAFIRYLRENQFHGRLHIELEQYEGDVFLYGADAPSAWEIERTTGREEQGDAAMQRLLVRSRDPGGVITVFEDSAAAQPASDTYTISGELPAFDITSVSGAAPLTDSVLDQQATGMNSPSQQLEQSVSTQGSPAPTDSAPVPEAFPWSDSSRQQEISSSPEINSSVAESTPNVSEPAGDESASLLTFAAEMIAAVERAASIEGFDFDSAFNAARVELGDDYPFIDPTSGGFEYEAGVVTLESFPQPSIFEHGVNLVLRKTVDALARKADATRFRELVAAEFGPIARRAELPAGFKNQLNRIAGTRVL